MSSTSAALLWRAIMSGISILNIVAWGLVAAGLLRTSPKGSPQREIESTRGRQLVLSLIFVLGCAFRSFLPRIEGLRIGLEDHWLTSAMIGRAVATFAELAFVAQWTLVLREWSKAAGSRLARTLSSIPLPFIAIAEVFSWYSALTTNFLGSVIEESIWAVSAMIVMAILLLLWLRSRGLRRSFMRVSIVMAAGYILFMWLVDVPMYVSRWRQDEAANRPYLSLSEGVMDSQNRRLVSHEWHVWKDEVPWMSLYFGAGVWLSIALIRAPRFNEKGSWAHPTAVEAT
jgi:hypothetical protein